MGSRTLQSAKGETQTSIIRDLQIMQFCRIQKHLEKNTAISYELNKNSTEYSKERARGHE